MNHGFPTPLSPALAPCRHFGVRRLVYPEPRMDAASLEWRRPSTVPPRQALHGPGGSQVWQTMDLWEAVFGCVASKGVTGENSGSVAGKELSGLLLADGWSHSLIRSGTLTDLRQNSASVFGFRVQSVLAEIAAGFFSAAPKPSLTYLRPSRLSR